MEKEISTKLNGFSIIQTIEVWRQEGRLEEDIQSDIERSHLRLAHKMTSSPAKAITDNQLKELHELEVARAYLSIVNLNNDHDQNKMSRAMDGQMTDGSPSQSTILTRMRKTARELDKIADVPVANRRGSVAFNFGSGT